MGTGISIGINVNAQGAQKGITGVSQGVSQGVRKLARESKQAFGGNTVQGVQSYNRHLSQLEKHLERVTQRVKTLQGAQAALLQQQNKLAGSGSPQLSTINKALQQNQTLVARSQARQLAAQQALSFAQQNKSSSGGGLGGVLGMLAGFALADPLLATLAGTAAGFVARGTAGAGSQERLIADMLSRRRPWLARSNTAALGD